MRHRFLWITDPWETLDHARDTTLRLAHEAERMGFESHWCDVRSIRLEKGSIILESRRLNANGKTRVTRPRDFDSLQYRVDPPVDHAYQHPLQLLALEARDRIVNPIECLLVSNEKLEGESLHGLTPPSIVSSQLRPLEAFLKRERVAVLKPLHQAQSKGITLLRHTDSLKKRRALLVEATSCFAKPVQLQRFLKGIAKGETRLWFLDGKLLATVRKLPLEGDFRVNIDGGSRLIAHSLTAREKKAAVRIGQRLRALGARLAAIDLIDGYVTDFNLTSPGLLLQIEQLTRKNLAREIVRALSR